MATTATIEIENAANDIWVYHDGYHNALGRDLSHIVLCGNHTFADIYAALVSQGYAIANTNHKMRGDYAYTISQNENGETQCQQH